MSPLDAVSEGSQFGVHVGKSATSEGACAIDHTAEFCALPKGSAGLILLKEAQWIRKDLDWVMNLGLRLTMEIDVSSVRTPELRAISQHGSLQFKLVA
jgi:hypothetical protein